MFSKIWTFSHRKEFAEKRIKKAEGAFKIFPRFAYAHCISNRKSVALLAMKDLTGISNARNLRQSAQG